MFPHLHHFWSIMNLALMPQQGGYFEKLVCHLLSQPAVLIKLYSWSQHLVSRIYWTSRVSLDLVTLTVILWRQQFSLERWERSAWALLSTFFFSFIFISWRLVTLQYCSGFCHTLTWISHGYTCIPHPDPPSHLPPYPIPLGLPSAPALSTCLMHPTWAGDLFHPW